MIATTATSARPEIEARGTIGDRLRAFAVTCTGVHARGRQAAHARGRFLAESYS